MELRADSRAESVSRLPASTCGLRVAASGSGGIMNSSQFGAHVNYVVLTDTWPTWLRRQGCPLQAPRSFGPLPPPGPAGVRAGGACVTEREARGCLLRTAFFFLNCI